MTPLALYVVFHVEGGLAVVTAPAEMSFGHYFHVHAVRSLFHLEDPEMTSRASPPVRFNMFFMVKDNRRRTFRVISYQTSTDQNLRSCAEREDEEDQDRKNDAFAFHGTTSLSHGDAGILPHMIGKLCINFFSTIKSQYVAPNTAGSCFTRRTEHGIFLMILSLV